MGKKRNTAKTGDIALYKSRESETDAARGNNSDDDGMYNEIDRHHNRRQQEEEEYLDLNAQHDNDSDEENQDDGISGREGVLDLGGGESSSSDDEEESDDEDKVQRAQQDSEGESSVDENDSSSSESEEEDPGDLDVRDWGKKKSAYYHGDTADLEIGQDEDDAFLEEEAAKEVQAARYENMEEDDFVMSDTEEEPSPSKRKAAKDAVEEVQRDLSKLSKSEKRRLLQSHHPELLPLVSHFSQEIEDYTLRTRVVENALLQSEEGPAAAEAVGATSLGLQLLTTKALVQSSTALNVAMYLLLKSEQCAREDEERKQLAAFSSSTEEGSSIQSHPVIARLQQWNNLAQKLEERVETKLETLPEQMENLVKASALVDSVDGPDNDKASSDDEAAVSDQNENDGTSVEAPISTKRDGIKSVPAAVSTSSSEEEEDGHEDVLHEAKFGLRVQEISEGTPSQKRKRRVPFTSEFGDEEEKRDTREATMALASTINAIEQRTSTKERKRRAAPASETLDASNDDNEGLREGLEMMETELARVGGEEDEDDDIDDELDDKLEGDDFYAQVAKKSKDRKKFKKSLYQVAPKYPGMDAEVDGERAISKQILKNRGLVAHKSKLNRNPRVKKREQYRKALVRRRGAVREVRTDEGHKYGGEETGIKSGLSRSRKLGVRR